MKLCQVLAIESGTKSKAQKELTALHRSSEKAELYAGISRRYQPKEEGGESLPDEKQVAQLKAKEVLQKLEETLSEAFDIEFTKDAGNVIAKASVTVEGSKEPLLVDAPVSYLLYLEKQLEDINTFVSKMPTLDPSEEWAFDTTTQLHRTPPVGTARTKKKMTAVVLYEATKEHPAQVKEVGEDVVVGTWNTTKFSGALPADRKEEILSRINKLQRAVKFAREEANGTVVEKQKSAEKIFGYLFS